MRHLIFILSTCLSLAIQCEVAKSQIHSTGSLQDSLVDVNGVPKVIFKPEFDYPPALLNLQKEATVTVQIEVDTSGIVEGVKRILHSTDCEFDSLAVALSVQYRFVPMGFWGKKSRVSVMLPLYFDTRTKKGK